MSVYRENDRWGALVGEHRAQTLSWFVAAAMGVGITIFVIGFQRHTHDTSMRLYAAMLVFPILSAWMLMEGVRLRRIVLRMYERGLTFQDERALHEVTWDAIEAVEAQYGRGPTGKGLGNERYLLNLVLTVPTGRIGLPKELRGFREIRATIERQSKAPWTQVVVGPLQRG